MFTLEELEFLGLCVDCLDSKGSRQVRLNKAAMGMKIGKLQEHLQDLQELEQGKEPEEAETE
jgi:hypothetical protein